MTQPDPMADALDEASRLYVLLAGKVQPSQGEGGRRPQPASRPPLAIDPVSLMAELEQYLPSWINRARWLLDPWSRVDITARTGAICPYCQGNLIAWMKPKGQDIHQTTEPAEVVCTTPTQHEPDEPYRWLEADWPRLGVLTGVREDRRYGPRLPGVASG